MNHYQTNYKLITTTETSYFGDKYEACFSKLYANLKNNTFVEADVYIKNKYIIDVSRDGKVLSYKKINERSIIKWLDFLKPLNINFEYLGIVEQNPDLKIKFENPDILYGIRINKESSSILGIKIFLNFLRYIYEEDFPQIIATCYRLKRLLPDVDNISIIQLSNYFCDIFNGHNSFEDRSLLSYIINQEEFSKRILFNDQYKSTTSVFITNGKLYHIDAFKEKYKTVYDLVKAYEDLKLPIKELINE